RARVLREAARAGARSAPARGDARGRASRRAGRALPGGASPGRARREVRGLHREAGGRGRAREETRDDGAPRGARLPGDQGAPLRGQGEAREGEAALSRAGGEDLRGEPGGSHGAHHSFEEAGADLKSTRRPRRPHGRSVRHAVEDDVAVILDGEGARSLSVRARGPDRVRARVDDEVPVALVRESAHPDTVRRPRAPQHGARRRTVVVEDEVSVCRGGAYECWSAWTSRLPSPPRSVAATDRLRWCTPASRPCC